jgi:very-short-patch-repair endonuclease
MRPPRKLVVEVDGAHHFALSQAEYDKRRSEYLEQRGLRVLRFNDRQVLLQIESVAQAIFQAMKKSLLTSLYKGRNELVGTGVIIY